MTTKRASILGAVRASGATSESPLRLHGSDFRAGLWLYEHDHCGMTSAGFWALKPAAALQASS